MQRLSGRILRPSMESRFGAEYTSSLPVIHVRENLTPEKDLEPKILDGFGRILSESLRQLDLFGSSEKTSVDTLPLDSPKFTEAYEIWVTRLRQDFLARQSAVRRTAEQDSLFWPTANVPNRGRELSKKHRPESGGIDLQSAVWPTPQHSEYKGQSQRGQHKPDDRLTNKVLSGLLDQDSPNTNGKNQELWPSPTSADTEGIGPRPSRIETNRKTEYLSRTVNTRKGKLNPDWVEQLMGLPVGWTDLGFWVMESCRNKQKKHSEN